jgi:2-haloacid dehalogenase
LPEKNVIFKRIEACVFDAYGTLFDVYSAVNQCRHKLGDRAEKVSTLWRTKQLEYTWLRSLMKQHTDFWQVTQDALDYALDAHNIEDKGVGKELMQAYLKPACYPDVPETIRKMKARGLKLSILSNGSPEMLEAAVRSSGLEECFDPILSVEEVGVYKPHPRVYQLAVDRLKVGAKRILFHSSNAWDVAGAATFGLRVVWVNRFGQRLERLPYGPDKEIESLESLPSLLGVG